MCTADAVQWSGSASGSCASGGPAFDSPDAALRTVGAAFDFLNAVCVLDLPGSACGEVLIALGEVQAKLTAAHAGFLRRFDAAGAHDADGYGSSSAWLAARAGMSRKAARVAVRQMRQLGDRPLLDTALAAGDITDSVAFTIAGWTRKLPAAMRTETDRILLQAAAAGASLDDLATIAACAIETWRAQQPDADDPDPGDRYLQLGTTFGDAGVIRGDLTPECAAVVRAVLESLGKKAGPEDDRTEGQRFHDALQLACESLPRVCVVPGPAAAGVSLPFRLGRRCRNCRGRHWVKRRSSWTVGPVMGGLTGHDDLAGLPGAAGRGHSGPASPGRHVATAAKFTTQNWSHPCAPQPRASSAIRFAGICPGARLGYCWRQGWC
jgi:hypothetical protein